MAEVKARTFVPPSQQARLLSERLPLTALAETRASCGSLVLKLEDRPFLPGQTVRGELVFSYTQEASIRNVAANFSAMEEIVHFAHSIMRRTRFQYDTFASNPGHDAENERTQQMLYDAEAKGDLALGEHTWRFSFELPRDIPAGHGDRNAFHKLVYKVEGRLDIANWRDVTVSYALEVRPTLEQHMNSLMQLPNFLTHTNCYRAIAPLLGPTAVEQEISSFNRLKFSTTRLNVRLYASRPTVLTFKTSTQSIHAQVEVSPARAPVRRVVAELRQVHGGASGARVTRDVKVIQSVELTYQSIMDIHMEVPIDENDLATFDYNLFRTEPTKPCINFYSFSTNWYAVNYVLAVRFEMQGWTGETEAILAEIPVTYPEVEDRVESLKIQTAQRAAERNVEGDSDEAKATA